jgi:16S rRNA (guanine966-N2)-methyltransferase
MRVIGGTYRSRRLITPRGTATRPTSDRLRETLFNVLAPRITGAVFVDLYAGSGAVGIEALSRGASLVYFVDQAPPAVAAIRKNLAELKIVTGFQVMPVSVFTALRGITQPCSVIFLDPPYASIAEYSRTLTLLGERAGDLLREDGIVVAEHDRKMPEPLGETFGQLRRYRVLEQGDSELTFYSR